MMPVRVVASAAVVGSVSGHNGCWEKPTYAEIDPPYMEIDQYEKPPCCKAFHGECFSKSCPVPTVPKECMHQWEPYEHSREFRSCTVNVNTCEMTCGCVLSKADPDWTHKVTTVDLNSCSTFENCHGDLTCTEGPDYKSCHPAPPAPAPPPIPIPASTVTTTTTPPTWTQRSLVADEGNELKSLNSVMADDCKAACEADAACHSFSFSSEKARCHLKDKCVHADAPNDHNPNHRGYITHYKPCTSLIVV